MQRYAIAVAVTLLCQCAFAQGWKGLPKEILDEIALKGQLPQGHYELVMWWEAEGKKGLHRIGQAVADALASNGRAWEAKTFTAQANSFMLYGPYVELEQGNYVALFRLKLLEDVEEMVARLDACVRYGQEVLNAHTLLGADLPVNRYVRVPLPFRYFGGKLECRVWWMGMGSIRVDRVDLFRFEGDLKDFIKRAPQPKPSGKPRELAYRTEPRPFADLFPRSRAPAPTLLVADLRHYPLEWQMTLVSLQGLVNRRRPQIYLLLNPTDEWWLEMMKKRGWIEATQEVTDPKELISRYRSMVRGLIVTDPKLPATKNIATMLSGVENALIASPSIARQLDLPIVADLRGRWKRNVDAYRWAFEKLWAQLNHHVIACLYPYHVWLRDYLVQHRIFVFWISGRVDGVEPYASPDEEVRLMERLLAQMPVNIPVMGYPWAGKDVGIGEGPGVTLFSEFAKFLVGSITCSNLSVHSGIPIKVLRPPSPPPPPPLERDKVYFTFIISDGDNLPVLTVHNFPQLWRSKLRGRFPLGWTISPSAILLIPAVVEYYYRTATANDAFLCAVSGIGYCYPDHYGKRFRQPDRERIFEEFLALTATHMKSMALKDAWLMGITRPELIQRYAQGIPFLRALFPDYGRRVRSYYEATYPTLRSVPVFHAITTWKRDASPQEQVAYMVEQIRAMTPKRRPAFLHVFVWNWGFNLAMLQDVLKQLGSEYVPVRPDHLAMLYAQELRRQKILIWMPSVPAGIEGYPITFTVSLHNALAHSTTMEVKIAQGMSETTIRPERITIAAGQTTTLTITGIPTGEPVQLSFKGNFGIVERTISMQCFSERELAMPLPKATQLRFVRHLEAEELAHRSGALERDEDASAQALWVARRDKADTGHIVYGPYAPLEQGKYLALFRLKRLGEGEGNVAIIDICIGGGQPVLNSKQLSVQDLPRGEFRLFPLVFHHPGGTFETRVLWTGNASIAVDSITIWAIGSGDVNAR